MKFIAFAISIVLVPIFEVQCAIGEPEPTVVAKGRYFNSFTNAVSSARESFANVRESVSSAMNGTNSTVFSALAAQLPGPGSLFNSTIMSAIKTNIPATENLINSVQKSSNISSVTMSAFAGMSKAVSAAKSSMELIVNSAGKSIGNTVVPLLVSVNGTPAGELLNNISIAMNSYAIILQNLVGKVNQTFNDVTDACQDFVTDGLQQLNPRPNSACFTTFTEAKQNFTKTFVGNAKYCVYNVINGANKHIAFIAEMQLEINSVMQVGKMRIGLWSDIVAAATSIPMDIGNLQYSFPLCESTQLFKSLMTLAPLLAKSTATCANYNV